MWLARSRVTLADGSWVQAIARVNSCNLGSSVWSLRDFAVVTRGAFDVVLNASACRVASRSPAGTVTVARCVFRNRSLAAQVTSPFFLLLRSSFLTRHAGARKVNRDCARK